MGEDSERGGEEISLLFYKRCLGSGFSPHSRRTHRAIKEARRELVRELPREEKQRLDEE